MNSPFRLLIAAVCLFSQIPTHAAETPKPKSDTNSLPPLSAKTLASLEAAHKILGQMSALPDPEGEAAQKFQAKFVEKMQSAASAFPLLLPNPGNFRILTLNQQRNPSGIDGFRIKNTSSEPRRFAWVFTLRQNVGMRSWYITPVKGTMTGFTSFNHYPQSAAEKLWQPSSGKNYAYLAVCQMLDNANIMPGEEYILWFSFDKEQPVDVKLSFDLFPASKAINDHWDVPVALGLKDPTASP